LGDLSALVERAWIGVLAGENPLARESMKRTVESMKSDLARENPTPLERLAAEQVIACWLEVTSLQTLSAPTESGSLEQAGFKLKRLESAQRRYHNAIKLLGTLHALLPAGLAPVPPVRLHEEPKHARA